MPNRHLIALLSILFPATSVQAADQVDFNRHIRPILSARCFACHGPDESSREADLRLDRSEEAHADRDGERAINPGKPEASLVLARITAKDPDERMPPSETGKTLTAKEIDLIRRWIQQGGKYEPHWAFVPPKRSAEPPVQQADWPRNAIDRFILNRLEAAGLKPSPQADPYTLIRRVYLDLVGFAPLPEEVDAFLADVENTSLDAAYQRLVDRLLANQHYGERWARKWLDLARYADTNGYEKDRERSIWPYRDWVIEALNNDMRFDEFTIKQIAGDLLPDATQADRIATGFHRNTMLNEEGGIDPLEFRYYAMTDRVATTGTAWLGLTLGCCQCHNHKYDPVTQLEYYELMAFLNNADEPEMDLVDPDRQQQYEASLQKAAQLLKELPQHWPGKDEAERNASLEAKFAAWLADQRKHAVAWTPIAPTEAHSNLPRLAVQDDKSVFASGDTTKHDTYELTFRIAQPGITALRLEALPDDRLPAHGPGLTYYEGTKGDFFLGEFQLTVGDKPIKIASATHSYAKNRFGNNPVSAALAVDGDPQTGWSVDGRLGERHIAVFMLAEPLPPGELKLTMQFGRHFASSLGRFRISTTTDPRKIVVRDQPQDIEQLLVVPDEKLNDTDRQRLREHFLLTAPELAKQAKAIHDLCRPPRYPTTLVLQERPKDNPRPTFLHKRGEFLQPTKQVQPAVPAVLHKLPPNAPRNRLTFARWLVSPENPLTARVVVNRHWGALFGRGIVPTTEDFGVQGDPPSHPELLDWLAVEFVEQGWSLKKLHRLIVSSATYRQSSRVRSELLDADPDNLLLARAPRPRLDAEVIRDSILRSAGLLSEKAGGPGVRPPQPAGVTEAAYGKPKWNASGGADRYRRSVYTFQKRTAPFAMYQAFDAPSGESCVARRERSNTPLQSLTLLNDVMFVEAAQGLGRMLAAQQADDDTRVRLAFRRVVTRPPREDEAALLAKFVAAQRERFKAGQLDPKPVAGKGPGDPVETATWTALARALFSLDETVTRN